MTDILGPADAPNFTSDRPADDRTVGATDTWMKDCTAPNNNDGTKLKASLFNSLLANLRILVRGNGNTGGGPTVVTEDNADDMLLRGVSHLIQRGQKTYAVAGGTANALTASTSPALAEYKAGVSLRIKANDTNTKAATLNVNGLGAKPIKRGDGVTDVYAGDIRAGAVQNYVYDGTNFQLVGAAGTPFLAAPLDYYVNNTTGLDTNDGLTAGTPFKTLQKAQDTIELFNLNGFNNTVHVAAGTYGKLRCDSVSGSGTVLYSGDPTTPANCVISAAVGTSLLVAGTGDYRFDGFKVTSATNAVGDASVGIRASGTAGISLLSIEFGFCQDYHILVENGGAISCFGPFRVTGNTTNHMGTFTGGRIMNTTFTPALLNLTIPAAMTVVNWVSQASGHIIAKYGTITGKANVTGTRYSVTQNAICDSQGGGATYLPGTVAGATASGGQYI